MRDFVGVRSCFEYGNTPVLNWFSPKYSSSLKNQALLFDKIGIINLEEYLIPARIFEPENPSLLDLDFLRRNEIVFDYNTQRAWLDADKFVQFQMFLNKQGMGDYPMRVIESQLDKLTASAEFVDKSKSIIDQRLNELLQLNPNNPAHAEKIDELTRTFFRATEALMDQVRNRMLENDSGEVRLVSMWMEQFENSEIIPLLPCKEYLQDVTGSKKSDAIEVVIKQLPIPDEETPWERIMEYRGGSHFKEDRTRLRMWIRDISSKNQSPIEISESLEYLISLYIKHMNIHGIKTKVGLFKTLIKLPFEIASHLVHFDIAKLPDPLFEIIERRISLWEAELNAPGNEIAYIIKSQDAFG